jgi:Skp family chaperone for outer membrane proteins
LQRIGNNLLTVYMKSNLLFTLISTAAIIALIFNSYLIYVFKDALEPDSNRPARIVTVDIDAIFESHHGRLKLQQKVDTQAKAFADKIEELKKKSVETAATLEKKRLAIAQIEDAQARKKEQASLIDDVRNLRKFEMEVAEKARDYQSQIAKASAEAATSILGEIYQLVERKSKSLGYKQVINSKSLDKNGVPVVLYDHDAIDFTSMLIDEVNKGK